MKIAIITVFPILATVLVVSFLDWRARYRSAKEAERFNVENLPSDMPTWTPMSGLNRMANRKLNRMYKGGQL